MERINTREKGKFFEEKAVKFLKKTGYKIIEKNFSVRQGEIDIIAKDNDVLVFIEVKARTAYSCINPLEAVDRYKQKKIISSAKKYMLEKGIEKTYIRFDVIGMITEGGKVVKTDLIKDAFQDG